MIKTLLIASLLIGGANNLPNEPIKYYNFRGVVTLGPPELPNIVETKDYFSKGVVPCDGCEAGEPQYLVEFVNIEGLNMTTYDGECDCIPDPDSNHPYPPEICLMKETPNPPLTPPNYHGCGLSVSFHVAGYGSSNVTTYILFKNGFSQTYPNPSYDPEQEEGPANPKDFYVTYSITQDDNYSLNALQECGWTTSIEIKFFELESIAKNPWHEEDYTSRAKFWSSCSACEGDCDTPSSN